MKLNFLDKKSLVFFGAAGAGFVAGNMATENGWIPKMGENQELIEGGIKAVAGMYLYKKGKPMSAMAGAGIGIGVNGLVDFYQYYQIQQALKGADTDTNTNTDTKTGAQNASLASQNASLASQDYASSSTDGYDQSFSDNLMS